MRHTTATLLTALLLGGGAVGCGSSSDDKPDAAPSASAVATTPASTPSLSQAEIKSQCTDAVAEAAPGWDDWNIDPGKWQDDPRTPKVCLGLADKEFPPRGNREFLDALLAGLGQADDPRANQ